MSKTVIRIENLSKEFNIYKTNIKRLIGVTFNKRGQTTKTALKDINLQIEKGESVCIIGAMGSGRTTLLKIIGGAMEPSSGTIEVSEPVKMMFDLKMGFVPELTGRENLYFKGSILGHKKAYMKELEQEIIDFADIEEYIDLPMKSYSPGMAGRLGFSVYMVDKPEIFMMDESFAVGQRKYREKCLNKLQELAEDPDVTFICVSKNILFARRFCTRGIVLDKGEIVFDGDLKEAMTYYRTNCAVALEKSVEEEMEDIMSESQYEEDF